MRVFKTNLKVDSKEKCSSFDIIGEMSDEEFNKIESAFSAAGGGIGIIPENEWKSSIWYDIRDFSFTQVSKIIDDVL